MRYWRRTTGTDILWDQRCGRQSDRDRWDASCHSTIRYHTQILPRESLYPYSAFWAYGPVQRAMQFQQFERFLMCWSCQAVVIWDIGTSEHAVESYVVIECQDRAGGVVDASANHPSNELREVAIRVRSEGEHVIAGTVEIPYRLIQGPDNEHAYTSCESADFLLFIITQLGDYSSDLKCAEDRLDVVQVKSGLEENVTQSNDSIEYPLEIVFCIGNCSCYKKISRSIQESAHQGRASLGRCASSKDEYCLLQSRTYRLKLPA